MQASTCEGPRPRPARSRSTGRSWSRWRAPRQKSPHIAGSALASVSPLDLLRWPGVIRETEKDLQPVQAAAAELLRETVDDLNESRGA